MPWPSGGRPAVRKDSVRTEVRRENAVSVGLASPRVSTESRRVAPSVHAENLGTDYERAAIALAPGVRQLR